MRALSGKPNFKRQEPQNAVVGDFDPGRPGLEIWCRSRYEHGQRPFVFDACGQRIADEMLAVAPKGWTMSGVEEISLIDWTGGQNNSRLPRNATQLVTSRSSIH
jgi:hypothetical protein